MVNIKDLEIQFTDEQTTAFGGIQPWLFSHLWTVLSSRTIFMIPFCLI